VQPVDGKSPFGSCENCGLVYVMKEKPSQVQAVGELGGGGGWYVKAPKESDKSRETAPPVEEPQSTSSRWRCPDCGTELTSDNESDLGFLKVVHIREYHPNRPT
jgi:rubredoxin